MFDVKDHELTIERNVIGRGWDGYCSCSDPNYDDGWRGHVVFYGDTKDEIRDQHFEHVLEVAGDSNLHG